MARLASVASLTCLALVLGAPPVWSQDGDTPPEPTPTPQEQPADGEGEGAPADDDAEPAQPAPAEVSLAGVEYFPLEAGRRWHYRVSFSLESGDAPADEAAEDALHTMDVYVAEPQQVGDNQVAVLEWKLDQELAQRSFYYVADGGLICVMRTQGFGEHLKDYALEPAQTVLPPNLAEGATWEWAGKAGPTEGNQTFSCARTEQIETPAGTFDTLVIEMEYTGADDSTGTTTRWLAPGVGIVKEVSEVRAGATTFRTEGSLVRWEAP